MPSEETTDILAAIAGLSEGVKAEFASLTHGLDALSQAQARQAADMVTMKADLATMKADMVTMKADLATMKADIVTMKADLATMKADVVTMKADMVTMKADILTMKADIVTMKKDIGNLGSELLSVRVDLMARMDRLQDKMSSFADDVTVNYGAVSHTDRIAKSASEETRLLSETVNAMQRQIRRIAAKVFGTDDLHS